MRGRWQAGRVEELEDGRCDRANRRVCRVLQTRDPSLYVNTVSPSGATFSGSALLSYKLNWQSVMFVGYGDDRQLSDLDRLEELDRRFFVKRSYSLQRERRDLTCGYTLCIT